MRARQRNDLRRAEAFFQLLNALVEREEFPLCFRVLRRCDEGGRFESNMVSQLFTQPGRAGGG